MHVFPSYTLKEKDFKIMTELALFTGTVPVLYSLCSKSLVDLGKHFLKSKNGFLQQFLYFDTGSFPMARNGICVCFL
jgi:hypothetical protein